MNKSEFKQEFFTLLKMDVGNMTYTERMEYAEKLLIDFQMDAENEKKRDTGNKGHPWSDDDLRIVLSVAPTKANALKYAKIFKRGYGSVEQIYRWAGVSVQDLDERRTTDSFVRQILRVAKELGLRM